MIRPPGPTALLTSDGGRRRPAPRATALGVLVLAAGALVGGTGGPGAAPGPSSVTDPVPSPVAEQATVPTASSDRSSPRGDAPRGTPPSPTASPATPLAASLAQGVGASTPTHISIPSVGIDASVTVYTDAMVRAAGGWVDPPSRFAAAWWSGGGAPSRHPANTVYVYGHVSRYGAVFDALHEVSEGDLVRITTAAGVVTYRVTDVPSPILKTALASDPRVNAAVPGRLVLVGCYRAADQGDRPTTKNVVVIAQQVR